MILSNRSKLLVGAGAILVGALLISSCSSSNAPLETVPAVDLKRYAGTWYEIAALPQRFEKGCHCVQAKYSLNPEGYVEVLNICRKGGPDGEVDEAKGKAFPVEGSSNSKLKVQFFWPFKGDYWILELDPNYQYVMVGSPDRESLWFLSRTPSLDTATINRLEQLATSKGFPVNKMRRMDQSCF
ncbi:lipocalin family protein [Pontibacter sp. SGAir0037]|uniref:lipocalin family protein n=1 Tax=Pontibacter sp. SGAir0037 TaxID=2571030 RepID=UPI0010CCF213|nr:lipocalin family protein [Pontibacter sp. SGAir0037]QCR23716.1 hypothetical protein C1N53_16100 [Pontibacter sp. SGAir0037]